LQQAISSLATTNLFLEPINKYRIIKGQIMSQMYDQLAEELFQILKGFDKTLTLFDDNGNRVYEPKSSRRMFVEPDKMMLSVDEDGANSSVNLFLSDVADVQHLERFINTLRHLSTRFNVLFNVRKYNKQLSPKDFAYANLPVAEGAIVPIHPKDRHCHLSYDDTVIQIFGEGISPLYGTIKTSYQKFGESRLIVKHTARINEDKRGSRSRNIHSMFVENNRGEKFRFPVVHLSGARAWTQHINQGGSPFDQVGSWIVEAATESAKLADINKHIKRNKLAVSEDIANLQGQIKQRIYEIRSRFVRLSRQRIYPIESMTLDFDRKLDEDRDTSAEIRRLGNLLGIDDGHPLAESLVPLVHLTKGGNMIENKNPTFRRVVALENADDLAEALVSEYGYKQGDAWKRNDRHMAFFVPEAFDAATSFLDLTNSKYRVMELTPDAPQPATTDKVLAYAQKWVQKTSPNMGHVGDDWSPKDIKAVQGKASQLAMGLKQVLAGVLHVNVEPLPPNAKATNPHAMMALKIAQILKPEAGLENDMLHNYLSTIYEKLGAGEALSPVENQIAQKIGQMVDGVSEDVEEDVWVEDASETEVEEAKAEEGTVSPTQWKEETSLEEWFANFDPIKFLSEEPIPEEVDDEEDDDESESVEEGQDTDAEKVDEVEDKGTDTVEEDEELAEAGWSDEAAERAYDYAVDHFHLNEFFAQYGRDFNWGEEVDPDDGPYEESYIIKSIAHYLWNLASGWDEENAPFDSDEMTVAAKKIFADQVKPAMEKVGYTFSGKADEAVVVSDELPPAGLVVPGDVQHDFRSDISAPNIHGGMTEPHGTLPLEIARLRSLAGIR
jgi:hypothetical protein